MGIIESKCEELVDNIYDINLFYYIFSYLSIGEIMKLSSICKYVYKITNNYLNFVKHGKYENSLFLTIKKLFGREILVTGYLPKISDINPDKLLNNTIKKFIKGYKSKYIYESLINFESSIVSDFKYTFQMILYVIIDKDFITYKIKSKVNDNEYKWNFNGSRWIKIG